MSQENVEIVRASFEVWNTGDMDAYRELLDPEFTLRAPPGWPEPGPFVGREAALRGFEQVREAWQADVAEPMSDLIEAGDRVVVRFAWHPLGAGPAANIQITSVCSVRDGRLLSMDFFFDHTEALEAAGLSE